MWNKECPCTDRTFNYNNKRAQELLNLFLEFSPDICFHLEIHPLCFRRIEKELAGLPKGLLHLEAGIQSLREPVLEQSRRMGRLSDALDGLKYLCSFAQYGDSCRSHCRIAPISSF